VGFLKKRPFRGKFVFSPGERVFENLGLIIHLFWGRKKFLCVKNLGAFNLGFKNWWSTRGSFLGKPLVFWGI